MKWLIIPIIFLMVGCADMRGSLIQLSKDDLANAETSRTLARNLLSTWKLNSGFIRASLGSRLATFPSEAIEAMDKLDELADKTELTDYDLGYSLGLRVRLLSELVLNAIRTYAPEVMQYLPLAL